MGKGVGRLNNDQFASMMRQYQRLVYTVCYQFVHDPHIAEDLTQETFLSAYTNIDRCDPAFYKQWLVRVAANKCKDHLKSAWVRRVQAQQDDALPEPRGAPSEETRNPRGGTDRPGRGHSPAADDPHFARTLRQCGNHVSAGTPAGGGHCPGIGPAGKDGTEPGVPGKGDFTANDTGKEAGINAECTCTF